jgi:hypothetical protein
MAAARKPLGGLGHIPLTRRAAFLRSASWLRRPLTKKVHDYAHFSGRRHVASRNPIYAPQDDLQIARIAHLRHLAR